MQTSIGKRQRARSTDRPAWVAKSDELDAPGLRALEAAVGQALRELRDPRVNARRMLSPVAAAAREDRAAGRIGDFGV